MKVFIVQDGCYSDQHICGIYSTREKAEQAKTLFAAKNEIEEVELDEIPFVPPGLLRWYVNMDRFGNSRARRINSECGDDYYFFSGNGELNTGAWAKDEEHAVKIVNELRTRLLALNKWGQSGRTGDLMESV